MTVTSILPSLYLPSGMPVAGVPSLINTTCSGLSKQVQGVTCCPETKHRLHSTIRSISGDEQMSNHFSTCVYHDGHLYGFHGRQEQGTEFRCVEWKTGKVKWSKPGFGCGALLVAGGQLIVMSEGGELVLVEPTSTAYREKARAEVLAGPFRSHLALANGKLYARDNKKLVCWNLSGAEK